MSVSIILSDGAKFDYSNMDIRLFEYSELDNSVYFEYNLPNGGYDNHAFINVVKVIIVK